MVTTEKRIKALAKELGVEESKIKESNYDDCLFVVDGGEYQDEEYLVLTYDEAYDKAIESIENTYDDLGLDSFSESFKQDILDMYLDNDALSSCVYNDLYYNYFDGMDKEDLKEYCDMYGVDFETAKDDISYLVDAYMDANDIYDNPISYYQEFYNDEDLDKFLEDNGFIDTDRVFKEVLDIDGIAHLLATYDGNELELENDLYGYRVN
jgi:hypothetical protein